VSVKEVFGNIVDIENRRIYSGKIIIQNATIVSIEELGPRDIALPYILPGFIDAHVHIESSLLVPSEFARLAAPLGTVATVSDPHEIANVLGVKGVKYMIQDASMVPFKFFFGVPSCVPATCFETAGTFLFAEDARTLFEEDNLLYLSEMMNYPGVLQNDPKVMDMLEVAKLLNKPIDGHAPGLRGDDLRKYIEEGITTDHECTDYDEALEKIQNGMMVIIREGSDAKNFESLHPLIDQYPDMLMFCSDDKNCIDLAKGHINQLVLRALQKGHDLMNVLKIACINPIKHYHLPVGKLTPGSAADYIIVKNLETFEVLETHIDGILVAEDGKSLIAHVPIMPINQFWALKKSEDEFRVKCTGEKIRVIVTEEGSLKTQSFIVTPLLDEDNVIQCDLDRDILKVTSVCRYKNQDPSVAFVKGFGLKKGAIASSFAHDSHNIIACGTSDRDICAAINALIDSKGGLCCCIDGEIKLLPLPVAGLMSDEEGSVVIEKLEDLNAFIKTCSPTLSHPLMTLSFLGLLVIPELKLSDFGLFNVNEFAFTSLCVSDSSSKAQ